MKLIVHIGSFKTGSTSIQDTCYHNNEELINNNIFYFKTNNKTHRNLSYWDNGARLSKELSIEIDKAKEIIDNERENFLNYIHKHKAKENIFIISSEFFYSMPKSEIELLNKFLSSHFSTIEILAFVRHPAEIYSSWVNEAVKQGYKTIEAGLKTIKPYNYLANLDNFESVFDRENLIIIKFSKLLFKDKSLIDIFFENSVGKNIKINEVKSNESLTTEALVLAEKLHKLDRKTYFQYLYNLKGTKFLSPRKYIKMINDESKTAIEKFSLKYDIQFDDIDLSKYPEKFNTDFSSEIFLDSLAKELNNLSLTKDEFNALLRSSKILKSLYPGLSKALIKIAKKSNTEALI